MTAAPACGGDHSRYAYYCICSVICDLASFNRYTELIDYLYKSTSYAFNSTAVKLCIYVVPVAAS